MSFTILPEKIRKIIFGDKEFIKPKEYDVHKGEFKNTDLDPVFEHIYAIFFYQEEISYEKKERIPSKNNPRYKYIINNKTYKAFYVMEYAMSLLVPKAKIQWQSETFTDVENTKKLLKSKKIRLIERPATESDLLAINESFIQKSKRLIMLTIGIW